MLSEGEPILKRMFFGGSERPRQEEKVLHYVIHRINEDADLHALLEEPYVRRNCSRPR